MYVYKYVCHFIKMEYHKDWKREISLISLDKNIYKNPFQLNEFNVFFNLMNKIKTFAHFRMDFITNTLLILGCMKYAWIIKKRKNDFFSLFLLKFKISCFNACAHIFQYSHHMMVAFDSVDLYLIM